MKGLTKKEHKILNYGIIVGKLETIARFNDKTDHSYNFELSIIPKLDTIAKTIENKVENISESYTLKEISLEKAFKFFFKLLHDKWFYSYQDKRDYYLSDVGNNFSLYFDERKREWIVDFVDLLLQTIDPIQIYEIEYQNLKSHYASDYDEFILESGDEIYYFKLSVID
ncbi:hypothetical protein [Chryseobacterium mucoviscidosis]|nr:hypothetical protein [Chryseobacterium mucoviscidosis]